MHRRCFALLICLSLSSLGRLQFAEGGEAPLEQMDVWLSGKTLDDNTLKAAASEGFAGQALSKEECAKSLQRLWNARLEFLKADRKAEVDAREIQIGELKMPFWYKVFGEAPEGGRSLFISMHGGGGAPAAVNDQQYENQKRLYQPEEGIYLVPRAPTNTWNLWHEAHIDQFFDRLITNMIVFENVNPDRVYIMGYSAGGDGVYQLAPRMADRLAAASMMAGHPNESRPEGLRNIGFTLHMGANDSAYNRNQVAAAWGERLAELQKSDTKGYPHSVTLHEGKGHWMNLEDAVAVPWMARFTRNAWPEKVVWVQDDVTHSRFYWLSVDGTKSKAGDEFIADIRNQSVEIQKTADLRIRLLLNDAMLDLNQPVTVRKPDGRLTEHRVARTIGNLCESLLDRNDPASAYSATIELTP